MQKSERQYLRRWCEMIRERHHLHASDLLWLTSLILFVISVIGTFTQDFTTHPLLKSVSIGGFVLFGLLWLYHLFVQIPAEMFRQNKEQSKGLLELEAKQRGMLTDNPSVYVKVFINKVILYQSSMEHTNFAEIRLYIVNGSMFPLEYDIELKETELTASQVNLNKISTLPFVYQKGADRLEAGMLQNSTLIRQPISGELINSLYNPNKPIYTQWKLHIFLTTKFENNTKRLEYAPDWDGVIDRQYTI